MLNIDTSNELQICRYGHGIKLLRSDKRETQNTIGNILKLPFPVYFNSDHIMMKCNEICAEVNGFDSVEDSIGEYWFKPYKRNSVSQSLVNEKEVIRNNKYKIIEDVLLRNDDVNVHVLSFKMPWYNYQNNIVGLFGCSLFLDKSPIAESLSLIAELGFLNQVSTILSKENNDHSHHLYNNFLFHTLSFREQECIKYFIQGKTAKETAILLGISYRTIEEYFTNIKKKLGCRYKRDLLILFK